MSKEPERKYKTKEEVLARGREAIGIPLKEIDATGRLESGKGAVGSVLEESWFGYCINSESMPDFPEAGVELKATPYVRTKKGLRAKERLVCNIINYLEEYKHTFEDSSFWKKCNTMLLMSYEHREGVGKGDFTIDEATLFSFPEEDRLIIRRDWEAIVSKIKGGKAHELSEGDTLYLGACTKGANASSVRKQPFSGLPAKQRAFSLKQSYMTYLLNSYVFGDKTDEHVIKDPALLRGQSFEEYVLGRIRPHFGKTQRELIEGFQAASSAKNINEILLARMLGVKGHLSGTEEFQKANIIPKTIRVNADGSITESMSFPAFDFKKLAAQKWEESELKATFEQTKFLFVVFRYGHCGGSPTREPGLNDRFGPNWKLGSDGMYSLDFVPEQSSGIDGPELVFEDLVFWNMPEEDLEEVRSVWERTVSILKEGVSLTTVGNKTYNNLPKAKESRVAHVRPHARNASDTLELPDGRRMTKQCFWLNNTYIQEQLEKSRG